jgi:ATP/maltotriose-dependent transcriptional regulator MalT/DNA-binding SARP family transcriptional activator
MKAITVSTVKTTAPQLPKILLRLRLHRILDRARKHPIIWITGPPGSGKTTLAAGYLQARRLRKLWYQMDGGDADPATFFYYLRSAVGRVFPRRKPFLPLLTAEYLQELPVFARRYFDILYGEWLRPWMIVFDNCQELPAESPLHDLLRMGLERIPKGGNVILISREGPPPAMARLRAGRQMKVIQWEELRLTAREVGRLARLRIRKRLSREAVETVHQTTGGWMAGVMLLLEHLESRGGEPVSIQSRAVEAVFDYFAGEILMKADPKAQEFLLKTAFLPKMTVRMAERLTGSAEAGRILTDLARHHYFTQKHPQVEPIYQYHDLFREFLLSRAKEAFSPAELIRIQHRAAVVLEAAGQAEDAVELFRRSGDWEGMTRLILRQAPVLIPQGRSRTISDWVGSLPDSVVQTNPWLLYWQGVGRLPSSTGSARDCFERAFALFEQAGEASGSFLSWSGVVDSFIYEWGDFTPIDRWIAAFEELKTCHAEFPSSEVEARVTFGIFTALMYRRPQHPDLPHWLDRVRTLMLNSPDTQLRMMIGHHLLLYFSWWAGDLHKAAMVINALRPLASSSDITPLTRIVYHSIEANYNWMTASGEACLKTVREGLETAHTAGVHLWDFMLFAQGVWGSLTEGDIAGAGRFLSGMAAALNPANGMNVCLYHDTAGIEALWRGDIPAALEHGRTALAQARKTGMPFAQAMCHITTARALFELGRRDLAADHLTQSQEIGRRMKSRWVQYLCLLIEAQSALGGGEEKAGIELLREALTMGREQGFMNHIWFPREALARLYAKALRHGIETEYVQNLIRRRHLSPPEESNPDLENWPYPTRIQTLGRFSLIKDGRPVSFSRKAQRRPLEMLKALIALGGREVEEERLSDALWPQAEGDAAHRAFATTLHRLRRVIGDEQAIRLREGRITLDPRYCWVDVWAFEWLIMRAEADGSLPLMEKALPLYQGPFLGEEPGPPWAVSLQERLRSVYLRCVSRLGRSYEKGGQWAKAEDSYRRGLEVDPLAEEFYQRLMICYRTLGRRAEAQAVYHRCRRTLAAVLGVEPSSETEAIARELLAK